MSDTIFGKIISGEIPSEFLYEDEHCIAINDINPQAPVHVLVIPKQSIPRLVDAQLNDQALLGHLMLVAGKLAQQLGVGMPFAWWSIMAPRLDRPFFTCTCIS